ncbi:MAG: TIGR00303 family protein [Limnospira sp. PMC 1291.21]|uniref:nicotinate mononucleotide-dependent phosphoribosyltransferase CobT n=1 Tax=Limnospira TaxID=2596745 RepID=UPI00028043C5|nr:MULTISPECIES: TIGR00303 family protein [Limnospira]EKD11362.1 nicotinate-nucleotide-dimethylbenzimidazole phosphoribosyltransferase [Arthrospira platensis C1]QJB27545.1 TIGR00303 family protein [Limnospira fusiformis SAG 85.79]MDT9180578.1 TIGR00303 family protein [Limnospira sp. PMC 1238.20]MDT9188009.1 TIGR00303 family protein [Limnospira sp. PMC 894.15]MDT9195986.1 TIGR00303 family protein [Limnospira sp. PMC 1245.20]
MAVRIYTQPRNGQAWLSQYRHQKPIFACVLGFTETGLIPGISAAGATPADRRRTYLADAEFLVTGPVPSPRYPLPPLVAGASPVLISRAVVAALNIPINLFNAGVPVIPCVPTIDLGGVPAKCLSSGAALNSTIVQHLFESGLAWGDRIAAMAHDSYVIIGECVVGGTTTALAVLMGLGIPAAGKVNSSHPQCNHDQKLAIVTAGLRAAQITPGQVDPLTLVAAVGDPMQIAVAAMTIAASRRVGVLLAGGTQMLAVYALAEAIASAKNLSWCPGRVAVGTTRWVAEDTTGDTVGLAKAIGPVPLLATQLDFTHSHYPQLQAFEQGYVKEGVGAGGCAIASYLCSQWTLSQLLTQIEQLAGHL